ncbi:DNA-binding protein [Mycobacteroides abscessus]|nr:hypothetical protein [Mycobacteroides abscessus]MBN7423247.1 helix-turn-helix domain-containing protein [Mycobacteroides abscessus subsp. massiliense]SHQ94259.1 DNA binding domain, excisionase family [Mycobacteroides abscessus subsp. abscessus]PVA65306.1 DNA-binding protein [Mycobacteroides abscessus]PVB00967.1 DNA-binding protein [Mycobacteroides abscessus]
MSQEVHELTGGGKLWTVEAVMERLSVGRTLAYGLMASGELGSVKVGRRRLVSESQLAAYIARLETRAYQKM